MLFRNKYLNHPEAPTGDVKSNSSNRKIALFLFSIYIATTLISILQPLSVSAISAYETNANNIEWQIKSKLYYDMISFCMKNSNTEGDTIDIGEANNGQWFTTNTGFTLSNNVQRVGMNETYVLSQPLEEGDDPVIYCGESMHIKDALTIWGLDAITVLCNSGFKRVGFKNTSVEECVKDKSTEFDGKGRKLSENSDLFALYIKKMIYNDAEPSITAQAVYEYYRHSLNQSCLAGMQINVNPPNQDGSKLDTSIQKVYTGIRWVDDTTGDESAFDGYIGGADDYNRDSLVDIWLASELDPNRYQSYASGTVSIQSGISCEDMVLSMNDRADEYQKWRQKNLETEDTHDKTGSTNSKTTCAIDGIGWIVCPVITFLGGVSDIAFNFLAGSFLRTDPSLVSSDSSNSATYNAWKIIRNIANIAFVIAFLIIIFSQISNLGITNYGIKKMLPRLIIAAILVNISFYICQIAVDLSNILGYSIKDIFDGLGGLMQTPNALGDASGNALGIGALIIGILAGGITLAFAISIPVLLSVLVALLMTAVILVGRTALVVMLVVISPLAFVAFILPNTEQWFKKWGKTFASLLLVFPIIAALFGAGNLAARVLNASANGDIKLQLIAIGVAIVPLFAVPGLLKNAMAAAGGIGKTLAGLSSKANSQIGNKVKNTSKLGTGWSEAMNFRQSQRQKRLAQGRSSHTRINSIIGGNGYAEYASKRGEDLENQEFEKNVSSAEIMQKGMLSNDVKAIAVSKTAKEADRVAAIRYIMKTGNLEDRQQMLEAANNSNATKRTRTAISDGYYAKGDNQYYGSALGKNILTGTVDLKAGMTKQINDGKISATTLVGDATATKEILDIAKTLSIDQQITLANFAETAFTSPGTKEKITNIIRDPLEKIRNLSIKVQGPSPIPTSTAPASSIPPATPPTSDHDSTINPQPPKPPTQPPTSFNY